MALRMQMNANSPHETTVNAKMELNSSLSLNLKRIQFHLSIYSGSRRLLTLICIRSAEMATQIPRSVKVVVK
jgi:hypothetical protein